LPIEYELEEYMDEDILQGRWNQFQGEIRRWWGELTDDEVDRIQGSREKLVGILQERYGYSKEMALQEVADFLDVVVARMMPTSK